MGIRDFLQKGSVENEIARQEKIADDDPRDADARLTLADLYFKKGGKEGAVRYYREALALFLEEKSYQQVLTIIRKALLTGFFEIPDVRELLSPLSDGGLREAVTGFYTELAQYRLSPQKSMAHDIFRKLVQLDPSNADALNIFRSMESEDDLERRDAGTSVHGGESSATERAPAGDAIPAGRPDGAGEGPSGREEVQGMPGVGGAAKAGDKPLPVQSRPEKRGPADIKEKFITLAKEKSYLESIIVEQNDVMKRLEKENQLLAGSLRQLTDDHKKLRDKMLEFDIVRNAEIAEMRNTVESLLSDNKRLAAETEGLKETIALHRESPPVAGPEPEESLREKQELRSQLQAISDELQGKTALIRKMDADYQKIAAQRSQLLAEREVADRTGLSLQQTIVELRNVAATRDRELTETRENLIKAVARIQELEPRCSELESAYRAAEDAAGGLREELQSLSGRLARLDEERESVSEGAAGSAGEVLRLSGELERLRSLHELTVAEMTEVKAEIAARAAEQPSREQLQTDLSVLTEALRQKERLLREKEAAYHAERQELVEKIATLTAEHQAMEEQALSVRSQMAGVIEDVWLQREKAKTAEEMRSQVESELARVRGRIAEAEAATKAREEELSRLKADREREASEKTAVLGELGEKIAFLEAALREKENLLAQKAEEIEKERERVFGEQMAMHEQERRELLDRFGLLEGERRALEEQLAAVKTELEGMRSEEKVLLRDLNEKVSILAGELTRKDDFLAEESARHERERELLARRSAEAEDARERLFTENQELAARIDEKRERIFDVGRRLAAEEEANRLLNEKLAGALKRIADLEHEQEANRSLIASASQALTERDQAITALNADVARMTAEQEALQQGLKEQISALHDEILKREQLVEARTGEFDREREDLTRRAGELDRLCEQFRGETQALRMQLGEAAGRVEAAEERLAASGSEKQEIMKRLDEALGRISALDEEAARQADLLEERRAALAERDQSVAAMQDEISRMMADLRDLGEERDRLRRSAAEKEAMLEALTREKEAIEHKRAVLEEAFGILQGRRTVVPDEEPPSAERAAPVPPPRPSVLVFDAEREEGRTSRPGSRRAVYGAAVALLVLLGLAGIYYLTIGGTAYRQRPPAAPPAVSTPAGPEGMKPLPLLEAGLRRTGTAGDTKMQAILLTDALIRQEQRSQPSPAYDFSTYHYFRVTISAVREILSPDIIKAPGAGIRLSDGSSSHAPSDRALLKDVKTFYRRESPVSVSFVCAFPKASLSPSARSLTLSFEHGGSVISLAWEPEALKREGLLP